MSVFEKLGFSHHDKHAPVIDTESIKRRERAHQALFSEAVELRDVCKFLLNGHPMLQKPIIDSNGTKYIITCISGTTTSIKIIKENYRDDFSISNAIISRKTLKIDDNKHTTSESFDITSSYMNGFSEEEMNKQLKDLYDLQEVMLLATGHISVNVEDSKEHYAA